MQDFFLIYSKDENQNEAIESFISKSRAFFQKALTAPAFQNGNQKNIMDLLTERSGDDSNMEVCQIFIWILPEQYWV